MRSTSVFPAAAAAALFVLTACSGSADRVGLDAAAATADNVTRYLRNHVVRSDDAPSRQLAAVRSWLARPSKRYLDSYPAPTIRVLGSAGRTISVAVYDFGQTADGRDGAWGVACRTYSVSDAAGLRATTFACPSSLPSSPN